MGGIPWREAAVDRRITRCYHATQVRRAFARKGKGMAEGYVDAGSRPVRRVSRRRFLYGAAATLGGVVASSCAPFQGLVGGTPTIKFWNLFGGGDGIRLDTMESKFRHERSNPGLQSVTLSWGSPYYT